MGMSLNLRLDLMQRKIDELSAIASNLPVSDFDDGSASYFMISGQATENVFSDEATLSIRDIEVYGEWGEDPRADPASATEPILIVNDKLDLNLGDVVHAIYTPGIHADTYWQAFIPGAAQIITGVSKEGTKAEWHETGSSMTSGCIECWPFIIPPFFDVTKSYEEGDRVLVPIPEFKEDTAYVVGDKVTLSEEAFNPNESYSQNDQVVYEKKLYKAAGVVVVNDPPDFDPSEWTLLDSCYSAAVYEANTNVPASEGPFNPSQWDEVCAEYQMWEVAADESVTGLSPFSEDSTYSTGDEVLYNGNRHSANESISAGEFDEDDWTEEDNFPGHSAEWELLVGDKYIDQDADCTVRVSHGMTEDPDAGHYVEWIRGELVWYDCFPLAGWS